MVAVLICSQARGGRVAFWIASPTARVESIRELIISFRFSSVYRQLTFRPARLMTTSAPSISRAQGPTVRASHWTTRAPPAPPLLRITASWPFAQRARTSTAPTCPLPPGTTIFIGSRSFGSSAWPFDFCTVEARSRPKAGRHPLTTPCSCAETGVDHQIASGDEARLVRGQVQNCVRDLIRLGEARAGRLPREHGLERRVLRAGFRNQLLEERHCAPQGRLHTARADGVDANGEAGIDALFGGSAREHAHRGLARRVSARARH